MGTLFKRELRDHVIVGNDVIEDEFACYGVMAKKYGCNVRDIIEMKKVLEYERRTDILIADMDAKDEQLAGFGKLIVGFNDRMRDLVKVIERKSMRT